MPTNVFKIISYAEFFAEKSKFHRNYTKYMYSNFLPKNKIIHHLAKFHSEKSGGAHCLSTTTDTFSLVLNPSQ